MFFVAPDSWLETVLRDTPSAVHSRWALDDGGLQQSCIKCSRRNIPHDVCSVRGAQSAFLTVESQETEGDRLIW